jgi:hypothetical protein
MKLSELIAKIGDENVKFQILQKSLSGIRNRREGIEVSFLTEALDPNDVMQNTGNIGIVVWVPREKWEAVTKNI